ncbi:MAG: 3-deoxy-8-phosphooctulonate synthase [Desulfomonile sp.]|nr:3-deoxy-8-phosphooctulonate synthase [Desulfomonile sp.]
MNDSRSGPMAVEVGQYRLGANSGLFFILGPCVIESEQMALEVAAEVARVSVAAEAPVVFKASFDKANRTSVESFRGPGIEKGLEVLALVREKTGLPILSDIHTPEQAEMAAEVLDIIQIPAFLCRQTDILVAAGRTGKVLNLKKGQFLAAEDMQHAINKVLSTGNDRIMLTERGSMFGYQDLVADMRSIVRMKRYGFPVVFDATHSAQYPGRGDACTGGDRSLVPHLARAAVGAGADGVFMEVHPDPDSALCDGPNSLALANVEVLVKNLQDLYRLVPHSLYAALLSAPAKSVGGVPGPSLEDRLKKVRLVIMDVDGALTDGRITFGTKGLEIKSFDVRDGHGIKIAIRVGLELAIVTGRTSEVVDRRAVDLGITKVYQRAWDKKIVLTQLLEDLRVQPEEVAVIGDDVVDIPVFRRVGVSFTVPEAPMEVRREASYITRHRGGAGAVREMIEMILKAQGKWESALARYYE